MANPNSGKGIASKYEDLMNVELKKKRFRKKIEDNTENCLANKLPAIVEEDKSCRHELVNGDKPQLKDFTDILVDSGILKDKDLSSQLLVLMQYFVQMKMNTECE